MRGGTTRYGRARMDGRNKRAANAPHVGREGAAQSPLDEGGVAITCGMLGGGLLRALAANRIEAATPLHARRSVGYMCA